MKINIGLNKSYIKTERFLDIFVPGTPQCTAVDQFQCQTPAATKPQLQWKTRVWHRRLLEVLWVLRDLKETQEKILV